RAALATSPCSIWQSTASFVAVTSSPSGWRMSLPAYTADRGQAVNDYLKASCKRPGDFLFTGRCGPDRSMTTRQYARLVSEWIGSVGLDPRLFGTHSLRRTKATLIYRRTGNLR